MVENPMFDVFLAHNSADKPKVRVIAKELKRRGLKPWLDEEQIAPGRSFQEEIQKVIPLVQSAAILIGLEGLGKWQVWELRSLISQCVEKEIPVIPVLLPGVDGIPERFRFLREFNWVSFEKIDDAEAFYRLEWGITGIKPANFNFSQPPSQPSSSPQIDAKQLQVFEFEVVKVEMQKSGLLGLGSQVTLNRTRSQARYFTEDLGNGINLDMILIPGGSFWMGTEDEEIKRLCKTYDEEWFRAERPQHKVNVSTFFMGRYPITQEQWRIVAGLEQVERKLDPDPSYFKEDYEEIDRWTRPVEQVSWEEAKEFCVRLSKKIGREYRLPTEAEWEYACRAGTTTPFHFGETISTELANYRGTDLEYSGKVYPGNYGRGLKGIFREQTTPVGYFKFANAFGLYNMHGNVWEWCEDDWNDNYQDAPNDGSAWFSEDSNIEVARGSFWGDIPILCRSAFRFHLTRDNRDLNRGFRVVCVAPRTT